MKKITFIIPHFKTWRWTAICIHRLKQFGIPLEQEIIVINNSPGHPAIKCITDTDLGDGVKVISGNPHFTSHGMGYDIGFQNATGDAIFTCETDSFPTRSGWFDEYVKLAADFDLIGPEIPQSSGRYIHPAGALIKRKVVEAALEWQRGKSDWYFCPGAGIALGTSDKAYHVVASESFLESKRPLGGDLENQIELWESVGAWQEMRSFDEDSFDTYPRRAGISNFEPLPGQEFVNKIGYEAGQWLAYFAEAKGFKCHRADTDIQWMPGHKGGQSSGSTVLGGFRHVWCGTVSNLPNDISSGVRAAKLAVQEDYFRELPGALADEIERLEKHYGDSKV